MSASRTSAQKTAVVFGAGKMACGLLGELLYESGYRTSFISRRPDVARAINERQGYALTVAGATRRTIPVRNCTAFSSHDREATTEAVAEADIVFTAVGIDNIVQIAPLIAEGVWRRSERGLAPLNIIASENLPGAGAYLRHQIVGATTLDKAIAVSKAAGFSAALTRRIMTGGDMENGELHFVADAGGDLYIDSRGLKASLIDVPRVQVTNEFEALFLRKMATINLAQAVAAYVGHRYGCRYIHEAAGDPRVAAAIEATLEESVAALNAEFPTHTAAIARDAQEALARICNPQLADTIERVARGPQRKLAAQERLVGPARLAIKHGLGHEHLARAVATALTYREPQDAQALAMQATIAAEGVDKVLTDICGMLPHEPLAQRVRQYWAELSSAGTGGRSADRRLDDILVSVGRDLSERHDPALVREILARIGREFDSARIVSYLHILMRKRAFEHLSEAAP